MKFGTVKFHIKGRVQTAKTYMNYDRISTAGLLLVKKNHVSFSMYYYFLEEHVV